MAKVFYIGGNMRVVKISSYGNQDVSYLFNRVMEINNAVKVPAKYSLGNGEVILKPYNQQKLNDIRIWLYNLGIRYDLINEEE